MIAENDVTLPSWMREVAVIEAPCIYEKLTIRPYAEFRPRLTDPGNLDVRVPKAWLLYRTIMSTPPTQRCGTIRIVTKTEKRKWWVRKQLVRWGII